MSREAFLTRRPKSAHCLSLSQLVGWPTGAKPETPGAHGQELRTLGLPLE
jgi:hypothetical protein